MKAAHPGEAQSPPARGHLKPLDGIRGLAILMVIGSHAFEANFNGGGVALRFIGKVLYYGLFGVDLFFVLSGFLITGILVDSLGDEGYFRKFYARRALRIFPLYYGLLLVVFVLTPVLHLHWGDMAWLLVLYLQNLHPRTIMMFTPGGNIGLYHFWSLAVEEQFYLVWPAVIYFFPRRVFAITLWGAAAALLLRLAILGVTDAGWAIHVTTACRADSLLLGGTLALLYRSRHWNRVLAIAPWGFLAAAAAVLVSILSLEDRMMSYPMLYLGWIEGFRYTVLAVGFGCLIAWSLRPTSVCRWVFERGFLGFLGKYSYGIYVLHVIVLSTCVLPAREFLFGATHSRLVSVVVAGTGTLAVSIVAAYLSYHFYEQPFLRLKHRFDYSRKALNSAGPEDQPVQ